MKKSSTGFNLLIYCLLLFLGFFIYNHYGEIADGFGKLFNQTVDIIYNRSDTVTLQADGSLVGDDTADLEDSGVKGENFDFDPEFYPYYDLLTDNEKSVYKQVYANALEYETTFLPSVAVNVKESSRAIEAVYNDHPELFWVDTSYSYKYNSENKCVQIILNFNATKDYIDIARTNFVERANNIINYAKYLSTDYEKEKYVHDRLVDLAEYDVEAPLNQSAYSALVTGKTVCAGYTRAFQYIMTQLKIPTYYVFGTAEGDHAWNMVKLDGEFYNVDVTWDDSDTKNYIFFNVSDSTLSKTHKRVGESLLLPECTGSKYSNLEEKIRKDQTTQGYETNQDIPVIQDETLPEGQDNMTYSIDADMEENYPINWWDNAEVEIP